MLIAKWELLRSKPKFTRKITSFSLILFALVFALFALTINSNENPSSGIYSMGLIGEDGILEASLELDGRFKIYRIDEEDTNRLLENGYLDVVIFTEDQRILSTKRSRSSGCLDALGQALKLFKTNAIWIVPEDQVNFAFPLWVQSHFIKRELEFQYFSGPSGAEDERDRQEFAPDTETYRKIRELSGNQPRSLGSPEVNDWLRRIRSGELDLTGITQEEASLTLPSIFSPPIPFKSTLITFVFAFPIYLFSQFYSSSIMEERINRRAEMLLTSPIRTGEIIMGKTLLHFSMALLTVVLLGAFATGEINYFIILIIIPIIFFFLALSFIAAVLSRSYKENSFIIIFVSVVFFAYLFFPAMFVNIHAASSISPISLIVNILEGEEVLISDYIFTTFPLFIMSLIIFIFGTLMFREEIIFSQGTIMQKILLGINIFIDKSGSKYLGILLLTILFVPVAYLLELLYIVLLFQVPAPFSIYAMLLLSAFTEEYIKILGLAAIASRMRPTFSQFVPFAFISGLGFFIGEKLLALVTLSQISQSVYGTIIFLGSSALIPIVLVRALALHSILTLIASFGLVFSRGKMNFLFYLFIIIAASLHSYYNLFVISGVQ